MFASGSCSGSPMKTPVLLGNTKSSMLDIVIREVSCTYRIIMILLESTILWLVFEGYATKVLQRHFNIVFFTLIDLRT